MCIQQFIIMTIRFFFPLEDLRIRIPSTCSIIATGAQRDELAQRHTHYLAFGLHLQLNGYSHTCKTHFCRINCFFIPVFQYFVFFEFCKKYCNSVAILLGKQKLACSERINALIQMYNFLESNQSTRINGIKWSHEITTKKHFGIPRKSVFPIPKSTKHKSVNPVTCRRSLDVSIHNNVFSKLVVCGQETGAQLQVS